MPTRNQPNIRDRTKKAGQANIRAAYPGVRHNEAERALRHWVIARRIGMGTRTDEGTRAFANLASVIETYRKRGLSPWPYLAEVIHQRRQGLEAPPLPLPARI
jgi:hypothetical protein